MYTTARTPTDIDLMCERCGAVVCANTEAYKYIPAGIYSNPILYNLLIKAGIDKESSN